MGQPDRALQDGERYYDPTIGRFTQTDPLDGQSDGYASGNPINRIDPSGLSDIKDPDGGIARGAAEAAVAAGIAYAAAGLQARGGETSATARGRKMHKEYDYGKGFRREVRINNGKMRADGVNFRTREVIELKPDNPRAIARGWLQARQYARALDKEYPGRRPFRYRVVTFR